MKTTLQEAIAAIKAGDKETGQRLLLTLLDIEPHNTQAWIWLSATVEGEKRKYCLEKVLEIDSRNEFALRELPKLEHQTKPSTAPQPSTPPAERQDTKKCPYCAEIIKREAVVCRFCGRDLRSYTHSLPDKKQAKSSNRGCIIWLVVLAVILWGYLLLPEGSSGGSPRASSDPTPTPNRLTYGTVDVRALDAYTNSYVGKKVKLSGEVFNINASEKYLQMWVRKDGGNEWDILPVIISWDSNRQLPGGVYEDTQLTVYGRVGGTSSGTNAFGGEISQPYINADLMVISR